MGYFSNATEAEYWQAENCAKCAHWNADKGCPVDDAHMLYNYELCNEKQHPGKVILDMLIPRDGVHNAKCAMFHHKDGLTAKHLRDWGKYKEIMEANTASTGKPEGNQAP